MVKIYTKTGDDGTTGLLGGQRVSKSHCLVETYGTVDELNSILGLARSFGPESSLQSKLERIQNELFEVGADLSLPLEKENKSVQRISAPYTTRLENEIDEMEKELPPLKQFIIPGGGKVASTLHFARTVCRRAERECMKANDKEKMNSEIFRYLNRLSDWLFCMARLANRMENREDVVWKK